ncbi:hypothetical protein F511_22876 [Dorcoceras hygrometricum]|uniref:Uncharacterized protein n=1 Tax=Dorcoceras hygrometricum TaxID=472368 RepID=A0A2Z7APP8_9LAMI|nr:hypothetical protein F511_22876 [Dorcoceras hygrometricum]
MRSTYETAVLAGAGADVGARVRTRRTIAMGALIRTSHMLAGNTTREVESDNVAEQELKIPAADLNQQLIKLSS